MRMQRATQASGGWNKVQRNRTGRKPQQAKVGAYSTMAICNTNPYCVHMSLWGGVEASLVPFTPAVTEMGRLGESQAGVLSQLAQSFCAQERPKIWVTPQGLS